MQGTVSRSKCCDKRPLHSISRKPNIFARAIWDSQAAFDTYGCFCYRAIQKTNHNCIHMFLLAIFAVFAFVISDARGTAALQFVAQGFSASECAWTSVRGGVALESVHPATNGWGAASVRNGAVWFDDGVASPLQFGDSATNVVKRIFAVVVCAEAADYSTLVDAPCPVAFEASELDVEESVRIFSTNLLGHACSLSVNGEGESEFEAAVSAAQIFVGGSAVSPRWNQNWRGGIRELIFLSDVPSARETEAVRRYLALKHSMRIPTESDSGVAGVLAAMNIDDNGLFVTVVLAR